MFVKSTPSPIRFGMAPSSQNPSVEFRPKLNQAFQHSADNGYKPADFPLTNMLIFLLEQTELKNPQNGHEQADVISGLRSALKRAHGTALGRQKANATLKANVFSNHYEGPAGKDLRKLYNEVLNLEDFKAELATLNKKGAFEKIKALQLSSVSTVQPAAPVVPVSPPPEASDTFERTHSQPSSDSEVRKGPLTNEQIREIRLAQKARLELLDQFEIKLKDKIKGQDLAIKELIDLLGMSYVFPSTRIKKRAADGKPRIVALLAGPSSAAKTETIKILSKSLGEREIITIHGREYDNFFKNNRLNGEGIPGYTRCLDRAVADDIIEACARAKKQGKQPPIILIEDLDKANADFCQIWRTLFKDGMMTRSGYYDDQLRKHIPPVKMDFTGVDIFCTTNFAEKELNNFLAKKEKLDDTDSDKILKCIEKDATNKMQIDPDFWYCFYNAILPYRGQA